MSVSSSEDLGSVQHHFISVTARSTLTGVVVPVKVSSMGIRNLLKISYSVMAVKTT